MNILKQQKGSGVIEFLTILCALFPIGFYASTPFGKSQINLSSYYHIKKIANYTSLSEMCSMIQQLNQPTCLKEMV